MQAMSSQELFNAQIEAEKNEKIALHNYLEVKNDQKSTPNDRRLAIHNYWELHEVVLVLRKESLSRMRGNCLLNHLIA